MKKMFSMILALVTLCAFFTLAQAADEPLTVTFVENPTTGYTWNAVTSDESILTLTDSGYTAAANPENLVGAGGTHSWTFLGQAEGDATATFTLSQGWEGGEVAATIVYDCHVDAALATTVKAVTGIPERYMPDKAAVLLLENPTTGYAWSYTMSAEDILTLEKDEFFAPDAELEGAGGEHLWVWRGVKEGDVTITFDYARSFEAESSPEGTVTYTFHVDAEGLITLTEVGGDIADYDPAMAEMGE